MAVAAEGVVKSARSQWPRASHLRINALHGEAGHVLHLFSLSGRKASDWFGCEHVAPCPNKLPSSLVGQKHLRKKSPG